MKSLLSVANPPLDTFKYSTVHLSSWNQNVQLSGGAPEMEGP